MREQERREEEEQVRGCGPGPEGKAHGHTAPLCHSESSIPREEKGLEKAAGTWGQHRGFGLRYLGCERRPRPRRPVGSADLSWVGVARNLR